MFASVLIIIVSAALFVYWFRYTCVLILNTKTTHNYANEVALANDLKFLQVQGSIAGAARSELAGFRTAIESDYRRVAYLLDHSSEIDPDGYALERVMLRADFTWMSVLYGVLGCFSERLARTALIEMSQIVEHHANVFGERLATVRT